MKDDRGGFHRADVAGDDVAGVQVLVQDGAARSERVLAGMWTQWMAGASMNARSTLLASSPLEPFAHQSHAVYGAMLPQPWLRFLLADEPGTGKTIMAGLYLREMQKYGLIRKAIIVVPANLVSKWQADFDRFFGGGLRRITAGTVREHALDLDHDMWITSLELAAVNPAVQEAIRPDLAGWDIVVFDEAHRLTPTAQSFHRVGRLLTQSPRALLLTATPHRGSEWLFRHLLHLVDPDIYPDPGDDKDQPLAPLRPGTTHFLRRMKEDLVDYDGMTKLFKGRTATNLRVPLTLEELTVYNQALEMVDQFFPPSAQALARMVYGKRSASCLHSLAETLRRRRDNMGGKTAAQTAMEVDPYGEDDSEREVEEVVHADSLSARAEKKAIGGLLATLDGIFADPGYVPSKWKRLTDECLAAQGIRPGGTEQAVVFTEYADTAEWITTRLAAEGYSARTYSGRQNHAERDTVRAAFMRGDFQVIVTTDAGNEGIDLQAAHVLVNYDIPWSLVRLEQRMGRIHRVGQTRDVELFNLVAVDTREGETLHKLLDNFVNAANELNGQLFDSLSLVAELTGVDYEKWLTALYGNDEDRKAEALRAARRVTSTQLKTAAQTARAQEARLAEQVRVVEAMSLLHQDYLERINPAIVDAYLARLDASGLLQVRPTAMGDEVRLLTATRLPDGLGGQPAALVAVSGDALKDAAMADTRVLPLGPGDPAFAALIDLAEDQFEPDLFRGGAAQDPTTITPYDLYAYRGELTEAGGRRRTQWAALVRVDATGKATLVRWETLANLTPTSDPGKPPHPARDLAADDEARRAAERAKTDSQTARNSWFADARRDLSNLPTDLTPATSFPNREERIHLRSTLKAKTEDRLAELQRLSVVDITTPRLVARIHVTAAGVPATVEEKDSEAISMRLVANTLTTEGWVVGDVHHDNVGYDLYARRGREHRLVEVKGVWGSASSTGVKLTGNEVLIATQHSKDYWLYVVDGCSDGKGRVFGTYRDPVRVFAPDITADAVFRVPGSSLARAANKENDPV
ncbi:helicase-related protein [Ornithinimicrobium sp. W1665]|uniref:helicase-related protein n=2 Tax=Ornithinimicrobium sp. W1665 TaxID=3416666 RepID=UPI003CF75E03